MYVAKVDVSEADGPTVGQVAGGSVPCNHAGKVLRSDDGRVVGSTNGHRQWSGDDAAMAVIDCCHINQRQCLARRQEIERAIGYTIGPDR